MSAVLSDEERRILVRHARGQQLADIASSLNLTLDRVNGVVMRLSTFNRTRSAELVRQHDAAVRPQTVQAVQIPAKPVRPAVKTAAPAPVKENHTVTTPGPLDQLLVTAEATGLTAAIKTVKRIRDLAEQLSHLVEMHQAEERTRTKIARLEAELASERAKLKAGAKVKPVKNTQLPAADVPTKVLRAWAAEFGLDCASHGQIPIDIRNAYVAAHPVGA